MTQEEKNKIFEEIFDSELTLGVHYSNADIVDKFGVDAVAYRLWKAEKNCQKAYDKLGITPTYSEAKKNTAMHEPKITFLKNRDNDITIEGGLQATEPADVQNFEDEAAEAARLFDDSAGNAQNAESTSINAEPPVADITPANETVKVAGGFDSARGVDDRQRIQALIERGDISADEMTQFKPFVKSVVDLLPPPTFSVETEKKESSILFYICSPFGDYGYKTFKGVLSGYGIQTFKKLCDKIGITPSVKIGKECIDKADESYHWQITSIDFLKIVAYVADNYATRAKTHKASTASTSTSFTGESLNYGADI